MNRKQPVTGMRAAVFAVALFAITLNFLQPLAHAALLRNGGPMAAAKLWGVFCLPAADAQDADGSSAPAAGKVHECCLGLAHAPVLATPSGASVAIRHFVVDVPFVTSDDVLTAGRIRDGPVQPRAPPLLV